ncbi:proprotein convertase P-domain-containing protein [Herbihabitans rhizosphaerae]|uniref:Proprotein convertase P-domain-containing protein n=1 Tax=Herbihabitans rhizosphaerae TaxID=1872711 RepID=A0A4Q7KKJ9_9PSEU|nr:trypsin-like serine protease [Herbihabitans rhizosphaerae]RZS34446.1 proprotein convertase P-domain-containing protein [Herbihabitans rhizosphaerae]
MKWHLLRRAAVAAIAITACGVVGVPAASAAPPPPGDGQVQPQIIGGVNATETYTFMVALNNGCGGSLVAPQWIVTATHCGSASSGRIGSISKSSGGEVRSIDRRIGKPGTDLTLMHLSTASTKTPIAMATANPSPGVTARLLGWGCTSWPNCTTPDTLKQIDLRVLPSSDCYPGGGTSIDVCIDGDRYHSACHGDSGGPAITGTSGNWTLVGETHGPGDNGGECATTTLYTGIAAHRDWIDQQIGTVTPGKKFENTDNVTIPDNAAAVFSSVGVTEMAGNAPATLKVNVDIKHTFRGDLVIDLVAPDGSLYRLKNFSSNDSADNVLTTYTVNASSEIANGTWQLKVQDAYSADTGYIDAWSVQF